MNNQKTMGKIRQNCDKPTDGKLEISICTHSKVGKCSHPRKAKRRCSTERRQHGSFMIQELEEASRVELITRQDSSFPAAPQGRAKIAFSACGARVHAAESNPNGRSLFWRLENFSLVRAHAFFFFFLQ